MKKKILILPLMTFMFMSAFAATSVGANPSAVYASAPLIDCPDCEGTGRDGGTGCICDGTGECHFCEGTGGCWNCNYTGKCQECYGMSSECVYCGGTGKCKLCDGQNICEYCHGSAECTICNPCTTCDGTGKVEAPNINLGVAEFLATVEDFPIGNPSSIPKNAWVDEHQNKVYKNTYTNGLFFVSAEGITWAISGTKTLTQLENGNYQYTNNSDVVTLVMNEGKLVSIEVTENTFSGTYTAPVSWPEDAPTEAPAVPTHDGASLLGAPLTTNLEFEPLDWPGSKPEKLTFETGETIYYMEKMNWQIYTNWAEDSYDMSEYDMLHVDLFPSTGTEIKVTFEGLGNSDGGQGYKNSVFKTLTAGEWNGLDIALSEFPGLISGDAYDFSDIKYLIFEDYDADQTALSVGNVYFYKDSTPKEIKYTTYENWQIKYGNEWTWSDNMDKIEDGLYKIEIFWEGTGFNVKSDDNPIKKDWYDINDPDVIIADECIAPVTVDVYLKVIDDETLKIGIGEVPHEPHEHAIKTTHAKVEAKCVEAGHEVYYECDCGKYFSDQTLTQEIEDLETWLAEDGGGYLAPLGHHFSGDVTYTWEGDQCTASWKCDHAGCNEVQTETVTGVYVRDSDATTESNEKGHYEATFTVQGFEKQSTATNSVEIPNTKLPKGLSGGAIAGISVGAVAGVALISYAVMFAVYAKSGKGLKFLFKSFDWLKKLFRMK